MGGVAASAFGAHGLKELLPAEMLVVFETAVRYQMYHALALVLTGGLLERGRPAAPDGQQFLRLAGWLFLAGILLFSGSLCALAVSGIRWLGAITPIGGFCLIAGWSLLAWAAVKMKNEKCKIKEGTESKVTFKVTFLIFNFSLFGRAGGHAFARDRTPGSGRVHEAPFQALPFAGKEQAVFLIASR